MTDNCLLCYIIDYVHEKFYDTRPIVDVILIQPATRGAGLVTTQPFHQRGRKKRLTTVTPDRLYCPNDEM
jgi:hypothetical protein